MSPYSNLVTCLNWSCSSCFFSLSKCFFFFLRNLLVSALFHFPSSFFAFFISPTLIAILLYLLILLPFVYFSFLTMSVWLGAWICSILLVTISFYFCLCSVNKKWVGGHQKKTKIDHCFDIWWIFGPANWCCTPL